MKAIHEHCGAELRMIGVGRYYCPKCREMIVGDSIRRSGNTHRGICRECEEMADIATALATTSTAGLPPLGWIAVCSHCGIESWGYAKTEMEAVRRIAIVPRTVNAVV